MKANGGLRPAAFEPKGSIPGCFPTNRRMTGLLDAEAASLPADSKDSVDVVARDLQNARTLIMRLTSLSGS